jgi:raffinose/stachyose/melibiose transport system substrate-binding protein
MPRPLRLMPAGPAYHVLNRANGQAAMELMGNWTTSIILTENEDWYHNNLDFFPFPDLEEGAGDPTNVLGTVGNNYYHVSSTCENPDEAFEMIQYIIDDEGVEARAEIGRILPIADFEPEDPFVQRIFEQTMQANSVLRRCSARLSSTLSPA